MSLHVFNEKKYVTPGERVVQRLPYSEVCMHMRVSDKLAFVELLPSRQSVQIFRRDGSEYSAPILRGEAGFYEDDNGVYFYPPGTENPDFWIDSTLKEIRALRPVCGDNLDRYDDKPILYTGPGVYNLGESGRYVEQDFTGRHRITVQ